MSDDLSAVLGELISSQSEFVAADQSFRTAEISFRATAEIRKSAKEKRFSVIRSVEELLKQMKREA